jgi:hypothetical protein
VIEMLRVTAIVTDVELIVMHGSYLFQAPLEEGSAGEGVTLFGAGINPHLAVFQTMLHQKQVSSQLFFGDQSLRSFFNLQC